MEPTYLLAAIAKPDLITFAAAALMVIGGAFGVIASRNPVHSALSLVLTMFGIAVLFIEQDAQFLAAVQVIVYAGAIVVLFLFVIMLLGVDRQEVFGRESLRAQRPLAAAAGVIALGEVLLLARTTWATGAHAANGPVGNSYDNVQRIAAEVFSTYLLPFEATAVLLVIAVLAAVYLARRVVTTNAEEEDSKMVEGKAVDR
ncbi:MAG: NADH-quinone oxidoreductase subunit J [Actinomycetota bacterium]|nr:NADH-quinone oxidoreductase subunit J [Actinomycetota bacterium]